MRCTTTKFSKVGSPLWGRSSYAPGMIGAHVPKPENKSEHCGVPRPVRAGQRLGPSILSSGARSADNSDVRQATAPRTSAASRLSSRDGIAAMRGLPSDTRLPVQADKSWWWGTPLNLGSREAIRRSE